MLHSCWVSWVFADPISDMTVVHMTLCAGNAFIVQVLDKRLHVADVRIALIGLTSKVLANTLYSTVQIGWVYYVGCVVESLAGGTQIAMRSIATKTVAADEVGKINALLALVESAAPLMFTPLYVRVYDATRDYWTSAFLAMGVILFVPVMPVFV